jgi:TetR/AcrR family transcriptional regulator
MLLNTMVGVRMTDEYDSSPAARELLQCLMPTKLDLLLGLREAPRS